MKQVRFHFATDAYDPYEEFVTAVYWAGRESFIKSKGTSGRVYYKIR